MINRASIDHYEGTIKSSIKPARHNALKRMRGSMRVSLPVLGLVSWKDPVIAAMHDNTYTYPNRDWTVLRGYRSCASIYTVEEGYYDQ